MKIARWILVIGIVCSAILAAGYRLSQSDIEASAAVPVPPPAKASLAVQATTIQEVEARGVQPVGDQTVLFVDETFGYRLSYPLGWNTVELSEYMISFRAPDGVTQVKVEAVGPLPADGLAPFVDRSLGSDSVISRQLLTVHGLPAQRVITFSEAAGSQVTTFYLDGSESAFVITGMGQQPAIELIARSFQMPQFIAQR